MAANTTAEPMPEQAYAAVASAYVGANPVSAVMTATTASPPAAARRSPTRSTTMPPPRSASSRANE